MGTTNAHSAAVFTFTPTSAHVTSWYTEHPKRRGRPPCVEGSAHRMALALSAAPLLGVELSAEDVLLERLAPPKLVHNVAVCSRWSPRYEALHVLPWLAHHNLLGVDHFFMYLAPPYTNASSPLELRVRALVAASPMVTLLQTDRVPTILGSASEGTRTLDIEGVSLTVVEPTERGFHVVLIPIYMIF